MNQNILKDKLFQFSVEKLTFPGKFAFVVYTNFRIGNIKHKIKCFSFYPFKNFCSLSTTL